MKWRYAVPLLLMAGLVIPLASGGVADPSAAWCIPPCVVDLEVVTGSAINLTRESAIFRGNLISLGNNSEVNVTFQWGVNETLGFETDPQERNTTGQFEQLVLGLVPDSLYYYRARAVGPNGTATGAIVSFRTEAVATIFDSLLPVGLAIAGFLVIVGLYAMSRRGGQTMGQLLVFIGGLALIFTGFDYQLSVGDAQIALMIAVAGLAVVALSSVEMVQSYSSRRR